ncbi:hypothetical protein F3D3_4478 [Fusibacter sp. 3D3]|nr:hypothetical protein F3D3_4478 [Fusibacter sp. 3D3]
MSSKDIAHLVSIFGHSDPNKTLEASSVQKNMAQGMEVYIFLKS